MFSMRAATIAASGLIAVIVISAYLLVLDHANTYEDSEITPCSLSEFDPNCSPSGWMAFLLGDLVIAIALGFFLHYMSVQSNVAMSKNASDVKKILEMAKKAERRRTVYVNQAMKNHFGALLIAMGLINRLMMTGKSDDRTKGILYEQHASMERIIQRAYATLAMSAESVDPMLIDEASNILYKLESVKIDFEAGKSFPQYKSISESVKQYTIKLDRMMDYDTVLK